MTTEIVRDNIFVVVDPVQEQHLALERAVVSAKVFNTPIHLHLFISVDMDHTDTSVDNEAIIRDKNWFADLVRPIEEAGLSYEAQISWSTDWYGAIIRGAERTNADMIMMPLYQRVKGRDLIFNEANWRLMRTAGCPILVCQPGEIGLRKTILAAVNFQSHKPAYQKLNKLIVERSKWMAEKYNADLHFVNAYSDSLNYPDRAVLAKETGVDTSRIHVKSGSPDEVIAATARELNADIVMLGTQNRNSRWRGNTAEKIFTKVRCDVMVINEYKDC